MNSNTFASTTRLEYIIAGLRDGLANRGMQQDASEYQNAYNAAIEDPDRALSFLDECLDELEVIQCS